MPSPPGLIIRKAALDLEGVVAVLSAIRMPRKRTRRA